MSKKFRFVGIAVAFFFTTCVVAQEKTTSLEACEAAFQKNNLPVLSAQLGLDIADAQIVQAKIWPQPVLSGELNAYNPEAGRVFDVGTNGQKVIAIEELIRLGGKRRNEIELAKQQKEQAQLLLEQLVRNLRFELRAAYYTVAIESSNQQVLVSQLQQIDTLLVEYKAQTLKGNLSQRDLVRLYGLQLQLKNEMLASGQRLIEAQKALGLLVGSDTLLTPSLPVDELSTLLSKKTVPDYSVLLEQAKTGNESYLLSRQDIRINESILRLERSNRVPDLNLGTSYDQRGGAFNNQLNLTFAVPLPLWNANKGNIRRAELEVKQAELDANYKERELAAELAAALHVFTTYKNQLTLFSDSDNPDIDAVYRGILNNFRAGNVSLLEFTDFMESYNRTNMLSNDLILQTILSLEKIKLISTLEAL